MAKSDFNLDEDFYSQSSAVSSDTNINDAENFNNNLNNDTDYSDSDFSDFGTVEYDKVIDDSNVVYEENVNATNEEKVKYFLSTLNPRMLLVMGFVLLILVFCFIIIFSSIKKNNSLYYSEVLIPDVVYVGETFGMNVINHGRNGDDLSSSVVTFKNSNPLVLEILNNELKGSSVNNTIIPVMEGKTKIGVRSTLGKKVLVDDSKEVVVCPSFNSSLVLGGAVSLIKDGTTKLNIDFGDKKCSEGVTYESSNIKIMTVDSTGNMKGIDTGSAILTVNKGNHSFSVPVYVTENTVYATGINVNVKSVKLVAGQSERLKVNLLPRITTSKGFRFSSSNESVATVSESGVIKAIKEGTSTIKVTDYYDNVEYKVSVVVFNNDTSHVKVTGIDISDEDITMIQGSNLKLKYDLVPDNAYDKNLSFNSSNNSVVSVTQNGVVYAKGAGNAVVTLRTSNGISKNINIKVVAVKTPVISASDGISSGKWHTRAYTLKFSGSDNGATYYYGLTKDSMNNKAAQIKISKDEVHTYYVKACLNNACSDVVSYVSKVDIVKPRILAVAGIESVNLSEDSVHIAISDSTSLVSKWCVTTSNDYSGCKWNSIKPMSSPAVTYTAKSNDTYYAFAKDSAGNISDGYSFVITNIG